MNVNQHLRLARLSAGLTQEALAAALNTSLTSIGRWENGNMPSAFWRGMLCEYFQCAPAALGWVASDELTVLPKASQEQQEIPMPATRFFLDPVLPQAPHPGGSDAVYHAVLACLCQPVLPRKIGLVGPAGSGKTSIMQRLCLCEEIQESFAGILWASRGTKLLHLQRWAQLLKIPALPRDLEGTPEPFRDAIGFRKLLIVLDDIQEPADTVPFLACGGPACHFVLTSRSSNLAARLCQLVYAC